jgi:hypothetical protein
MLRIAFASLAAFVLSAEAHATPYAPMQVFAPLAGRTFTGEGVTPDGSAVADVAHWEYIIGGRAIQSTHSVNDGAYGGRTIVFYDEGAQAYVFHYFTTAGFHSEGTLEPVEGGLDFVEAILGHPTITEVRGQIRFTGTGYEQSSRSLSDGEWSEAGGFSYVETPGADVLFPAE